MATRRARTGHAGQRCRCQPQRRRPRRGRGLWLPTALLGRFGADRHAVDDAEIVGRFTIDDTPVELHHRIDEHGAVTAEWVERWGDPDRTSTFGWHTCGGDVTAHARFGGLTIPSAGRFGWFYGSDRWNDGEFFRYEITDIYPTLCPAPPPPSPCERDVRDSRPVGGHRRDLWP